MASRYVISDAQVEKEIARLKKSPAVLLSKMEERIRYRRRQYLYNLRVHERRGNELMEKGVTMESLQRIEEDYDDD